jgi:hypothetical protein
MAVVTLVHPEVQLTVPILEAMNKCTLFQKNVMLAGTPYRVQSAVSLSVFREFVSALEGKSVTITNTNFADLQRLCEEFGFDRFIAKLAKFRPSTGLQSAEDTNARVRIAVLEEEVHEHDRDIAMLLSKFNLLSTKIGHLEAEITVLQLAASGTQSPSKQGSKPQSPRSPSKIQPKPTGPSIDSRIISDFPEIFAEFRGKRFSLLWRGSSDGFGASEFHRRCDGHANTLTVILNKDGNIFGGFTPVKWGSNTSFKADDSLKSFLFTLKNPHNFPAKKFALKGETRHLAICCDSETGPDFHDIGVSDNCNTNTNSSTFLFGSIYTNDTGQDKTTFFTGSGNYKVKDIEVFEITN